MTTQIQAAPDLKIITNLFNDLQAVSDEDSYEEGERGDYEESDVDDEE